MAKSRVNFVAISTVIVVVTLLGLFLFRWHLEDWAPSKRGQETATPPDLGITYLPLSPRLSAYYDLGVDSGALLTEVTPNSPADKAASLERKEHQDSGQYVVYKEQVPMFLPRLVSPSRAAKA